MESYKLIPSRMDQPTGKVGVIQAQSNMASIPFDPDNTDYQQFLKDWEAGAEVLNPDGTPAPYVAPEAK